MRLIRTVVPDRPIILVGPSDVCLVGEWVIWWKMSNLRSPASTCSPPAPRGVRRLWAVHDQRLAFYEAEVLPGGCFFANAHFEFNARPGVIRDRLAAELTDWMTFLTGLAADAVTLGDLRPAADPRGIAYLTESLGVCAVMQAPVLGRAVTFPRARRALLEHLRALATDPTILPELT